MATGAYLCISLIGVFVAQAALPARRTTFVASTNGDSGTFQPLADLLIAHGSSWNVASAYCSSPGEVSNATVLPSPPFCYRNWTLPIRDALGDSVLHIPIIQLLGDSGPLNFKHPYIFAEKYVAWAQQWGFDGYLLDAEFKSDDAAFKAFLDVFGAALHAANRTLGVFLYPDLGKAKYVYDSAADYFLGTWTKCSTLPNLIWALHHSYPVKGGIMLYQRDAACDGHGIDTAFSTMTEAGTQDIGFWANAADMGDSWYSAMAAWLNKTQV